MSHPDAFMSDGQYAFSAVALQVHFENERERQEELHRQMRLDPFVKGLGPDVELHLAPDAALNLIYQEWFGTDVTQYCSVCRHHTRTSLLNVTPDRERWRCGVGHTLDIPLRTPAPAQ